MAGVHFIHPFQIYGVEYEISKNRKGKNMKRLLGFVLMALVLVPLIGFVKPACAMPEADAIAIVDLSYQAVQNTLAELQAANGSGDTARIDQALQALDLAIKIYAVASGELARIQAGEPGDNSALTACNVVASDLNSFAAQMTANNPAGAQSSFASAQKHGANLPPMDGDILPAGIASLNSQIIASASEAITILRAAGITSSVSGSESLGLNTQVGSPI